jgi:tetratricopeptide (TPR) repeat protein
VTHTLDVLESASRALTTEMRGPISRVLASLAERLASKLIFQMKDCSSSSEEGIRAAELVIKHDPKRASGYSYRGTALSRTGRYQDALAAFDEAIRLNERLAKERTETGKAASAMHRHQNAADALAEATRFHKKLSQAYVGRGSTLLRMGRYQDALAAFDEAIRLNPVDANAHLNRGECLLMQGCLGDAETSLRRAIDLRPEDMLEPQILLAAVIRRPDPSQAFDLAESALEDLGEGATPFRCGELRALAYLLIGDPDLAVAELRTVAASHASGDVFEQPLYALLDDPPVPGLSELLGIWKDIQHNAHNQQAP